MNGIYILLTIFCYFALLMLVAKLTSRRADNDAFFRGNRQSPWYVVAFGMVGASLSGVTFVSVPGMVRGIDMTYMQTCLGFFVGYLLAFECGLESIGLIIGFIIGLSICAVLTIQRVRRNINRLERSGGN